MILGAHPGRYVVLTVADTAQVSNGNSGKSFEPFFTTKEKGKGTDLVFHWSMRS